MAQTPAGLKKCQALFLGPFIKYDNNVSNGKRRRRKKNLWLQQYKLKLAIKEWVIKSPKTFAALSHKGQ